MVFHDMDGVRTQAIAKQNEVAARPPRIRRHEPIAVEEMRHFRNVLGTWVFLHTLGVGKLSVAGCIEAERHQILQRRKMQSFG